jgi:tRNA A-37 threonylcarbamoyl transferase component Bud32
LRCETRGPWRWYVRGGEDDDALRPWIDDIDRTFDAKSPDVKQLKDDVGTDVALALRPRPLVFKRFNWSKWYAPLADVVRGTRAARAFRLGLALDAVGVPTAPVVAFGEQMSGGMPTRSCLVMRYVEQARTLTALIGDRNAADADADAALARAADIIAALHEAGFSHRDLKSQNILVSPASPKDLTLIDLDGLRYVAAVSRRRRGKNLARLRQDVVAFADGERRWDRFMERYETASGCRALKLPTYRKQRH